MIHELLNAMQRTRRNCDSTSLGDFDLETRSPRRRVVVLKCSSLPLPELNQTRASIIVVISAVLCFFCSIEGEFVFDDTEAILKNRDVRLETSFFSIFKHDFWGNNITSATSHKSYRPITVWTFRMNYWAAGGYKPAGFHVINIVLHALNCMLSLRVFSVLFGGTSVSGQGTRIFLSARSSFLAALMFSTHPIHTENVAGIVGRADLLCAFFFLVSFLSYTRSFSTASRRTTSTLPEAFSSNSLCACIIFAILALLSKEQGITVLGLCAIYDVIQIITVKRNILVKIFKTATVNKEDQPWLTNFLKRMLVLAISSIVLLLWRMKIMGSHAPKFQEGDNPSAFAGSWLIRVVNYNYIYCLNVWLLLNPLWLCFDWAMGCVPLITSTRDMRILAPVILWLSLIVFLWKVWHIMDYHVGRTALMLLAFIIIPFLPSANVLFTVGFVIAERNLYISSLGFAGLVVLGVVVLSENRQYGKALGVCIYLLVVISVLRCVQRSQDWLSEERLFRSGEFVCPLNAKVHYNIGNVISKKGEVGSAIKYYRESIRLNPSYDQPLNNLGNLLQMQGKPLEAEQLLTMAIKISPTFAAGWMNLGVTKAHLKKIQEAETCYMNAIKHRKFYPDAFFNLGNLYLETKQFDKSITAYKTVVKMKPDHESSWINLILVYDEVGQASESLKFGEKAAHLLPNSAGVMYALGNVYAKGNKYQEAERYYLRAIQLNPNHSSYNGNIAVLYHRWGKYKEAREYYKRSLKIDPKNPRTIENYEKLQRTISERV